MTWDSVPWAVGGGAQHSPELARLVAYTATSGADGVVQVGDLKVVPLEAPGGSVRVLMGACLIPGRFTGQVAQTYSARNLSEDVVAITATGSGSGRVDMVVARIEDPYPSGSAFPTPPDPATGPYVFSRVISNVPASAIASGPAARAYLAAEGITATPLAGITLPASTGTITEGMITDLRTIARPRSRRIMKAAAPIADQFLDTDVRKIWPSYRPVVHVPTWANHAVVTVTLSSIGLIGDGTAGRLMAVLGGTGTPGAGISTATTEFVLPSTDVGAWRSIVVAGDFGDVSAYAGQDVYLQVEGWKNLSPAGYLTTGDGTQVVYDIYFEERI